MNLLINYKNVKVSDYLNMLEFYNLQLKDNVEYKKKCRLIENRFVCLNALFKKEGESSGN
ncbi:hypothetical protein [Bacillus cereus]|uniref:hypothetical protein n=1 Tax=Bacillus cereus TaxID=1396 RepID=UPI000995BA03|nr:hypothetical protein BHL54_02780 [Bacillus cereus]